jgi:hypothetical protein
VIEIVGVGFITTVFVTEMAVAGYNAVNVTLYVPGDIYVTVCAGDDPLWPLPNLQTKPTGLPVQFWVNVTA